MAKRKTELPNINPESRTEKRDYWNMLKNAFGEKPTSVNAQLVAATEQYRQELINIVKGRFEVTCPDWWSKDYLLTLLICAGRFYITDTSIGVCPLNGGSHGLNVFERPSAVTIANPVLGTFDRKLTGKNADAVVVYLYDDRYYRSFMPIIDRFAQRLANCDCSIDVNLLNTRVPFIFNVHDSKQAATAKELYEKVSQGEPAIFTTTDDLMDPSSNRDIVETMPVKNNYVADMIIEAKRAIVSEFLTYCGINNLAYEKKERLIVDEVRSNNAETEYNVAYINNNLQHCSEEVRKMFDIEFDIKLKEGDSYEMDIHKEINEEPSDRGSD